MLRLVLSAAVCLPLSVTAQAPASLPFDPPAGWTRSQDPRSGLVMFSPPGLSVGRTVVMTVFRSEAYAGDAAAFHDEVVRRAMTNARVLEPAQSGKAGGFYGTALHQQLPNGLQMWFRIYTARWADRGQTFILSANAPELMQQFAAMTDSLMARIAVPGTVAAQPAPAQLGAPTASVGDYLYTVPQGWTTQPSGASLWIVSPPSETGERCTISLWPMVQPSGDVLNDAAQAWGPTFKEFTVPQGVTTQLIRGVSAQGWEYAIVHRDMAAPGSPDATVTGFVMMARLGNREAMITWLSKAQLYSSCVQFYTGLPKVWPRFFATLGFRGWTAPAGSGLAKGIIGSWESFGSSTGGGAVLQYAFTPAGRYAFFGVGQRYMALSRFEAAVWTSTTFGDGSYSVRGNELTLTPDRGPPETYVIRLEQESKDGRNWIEKLYMMKPERVMHLDGARVEDNEVGLARVNR